MTCRLSREMGKCRRLISLLTGIAATFFLASAQEMTPIPSKYQLKKDKLINVSNSGKPMPSNMRIRDQRGAQIVKRGIQAPKGLQGRHLAMWQSHGRYFDLKDLSWKWQRPALFQTAEDIFTQSFMVPFLVPMLENAGANVFLPRERDWNTTELVIDNDSTETTSPRIHGRVETRGKWKSNAKGFADVSATYAMEENPFECGSFLSSQTVVKKGKEADISWWGNIPQRGEYAVYVSYATLPKSTSDARYTVHSAGADVPVSVNQRMGGGTWIYIGSYEFMSGEQKLLSLTNKSSVDGVVTADALRIGGGMGNIVRGIADSTEFIASGMPRFVEGARYHMQWSGIPSSVWSQNEFADDYRDDLMSRGAWVKYLSGGSWVNPNGKGIKIPVDMAFAWHTDAGAKPDASIVGTLGIYTLRCETGTKLDNGSSRGTSRELTEILLSQLEKDLTSQWDSLWTIRDIWNKSYSESRTTGTPAVLLELLSHQNFEDMKFGLDPAFRFTASRSCYKAILKYLSLRYGCTYVVQPLPVKAFSARLVTVLPQEEVQLSWLEQEDKLEPTAKPSYFIVHQMTDDGGWDLGTRVEAALINGYYSISLPVQRGHIHSYKIVAGNEGGLSFPSEVLSVGIPENPIKTDGAYGSESLNKVTIINAFTRISGPKWFDTPYYAGFDNRSDSGVPYFRDWAFVGEQFEFNRGKNYTGGSGIGFGSCYEDYTDKVIGGNSFNYPYVHGLSLFKAGYAFDSCSAAAFELDHELAAYSSTLDIICGKECVVKTGTRTEPRGGIYSPALVSSLGKAVSQGCNILISGAYIAKEAEESPAEIKKFVTDTLGFSLRREHGSRNGVVSCVRKSAVKMNFPSSPCAQSYCVESPDALSAYRMGSSIYMKYDDSSLASGVWNDFGTYRVAAFGFPIEILSRQEFRDTVLKETMDFLTADKGRISVR